MGWQTFEQEIKKLSEKIEFNNYHPDMIFGITRGGVVPARLLSSSLLVKDMICISVRKIGGERKVITDILDDIFGKNVLLVEDMLETGRSLIAAKNYIESKGAKVRTACLYIMPISEVQPDFYLNQINKPVNFPWE